MWSDGVGEDWRRMEDQEMEKEEKSEEIEQNVVEIDFVLRPIFESYRHES